MPRSCSPLLAIICKNAHLHTGVLNFCLAVKNRVWFIRCDTPYLGTLNFCAMFCLFIYLRIWLVKLFAFSYFIILFLLTFHMSKKLIYWLLVEAKVGMCWRLLWLLYPYCYFRLTVQILTIAANMAMRWSGWGEKYIPIYAWIDENTRALRSISTISVLNESKANTVKAFLKQ